MQHVDLSPALVHLKVVPMTPDMVDKALPLVRAVRSDLSLEDWRAFCAPFLSDPTGFRGLECVADENDYLMGLAGYEARTDLRHGRVLAVDPFVAADLYGRNLAAQILLARLDKIAARIGCGAVHVAYDSVDGLVPRNAGNTFDKFFEKGYRADSLRLCKHLPQAV